MELYWMKSPRLYSNQQGVVENIIYCLSLMELEDDEYEDWLRKKLQLSKSIRMRFVSTTAQNNAIVEVQMTSKKQHYMETHTESSAGVRIPY